MNLDDNHEMDGVLNTRITQDFMANGIIDERINKLSLDLMLNGKDLASGIYYYQLVAGDFREVKKMILLR